MDNPSVTISGFEIAWDLKAGLNLWAGVPTLSMWIPSSVASMMSAMVAMVGVERFKLCMQLGGQQSIEDDWKMLEGAPSYEEGFKQLARSSWPAGWGLWELLAFDRERKEARYRVLNGWEALYQRALGVTWGSSMTAGKLAGLTARVFGVPCWAEQVAFAAGGAEHDEFVVRPNDRTVEERMSELLATDQATRADFAVALERLKTEVAERQRTEQELREKLDLIHQQEAALRALGAPILQVWEGVLTVPVMGGLDSQRAFGLMERLLQAIAGSPTRSVILDLTAVDEVDSGTADHLIRIVRAVELLGARVVVTGIRPAVAQIIASLGVDLGSIATLRNLQEGLKACMPRPGT
jgi:rsbT co-antagonist protein RsbR